MFSDHFHFEILNYLRGLYFEGYKKLAREGVCLVYLLINDFWFWLEMKITIRNW